MAKLTKAQRNQIRSALASIDRLIAFIESDKIAICRTGAINADVPNRGDGSPEKGGEYRAAEPFETKQYKGRDDSEWSIDWVRTLSPISKGIGSDLVAAYTARQTLSAILES